MPPLGFLFLWWRSWVPWPIVFFSPLRHLSFLGNTPMDRLSLLSWAASPSILAKLLTFPRKAYRESRPQVSSRRAYREPRGPLASRTVCKGPQPPTSSHKAHRELQALPPFRTACKGLVVGGAGSP